MEISTGIQAFIVALQDWALGFFFSSFLIVLYPTHVWKGGVGGGVWGGVGLMIKQRKEKRVNILMCIWEIVLGLRSVHMSSLRCLHRNKNLFYILLRVRIAPPK